MINFTLLLYQRLKFLCFTHHSNFTNGKVREAFFYLTWSENVQLRYYVKVKFEEKIQSKFAQVAGASVSKCTIKSLTPTFDSTSSKIKPYRNVKNWTNCFVNKIPMKVSLYIHNMDTCSFTFSFILRTITYFYY